jgi:hypothetical protein
LTAAYILESVAIAAIGESESELPTDTVLEPSITGLPTVIIPGNTPTYGTSAWIMSDGFTLTQATRDALFAAKKFVHFWGFIRFRDAFYDVSGIERTMRFRYTWRYTTFRNFGSNPTDPPFGLWDGKYEEEKKKAN